MVSPVGKNKKNMIGFKTEYLKVLNYSHYDTNVRKHIWICECNNCGNEFKVSTSLCARQKSCGCINHHALKTVRIVNEEKDHLERQKLLRRKWI